MFFLVILPGLVGHDTRVATISPSKIHPKISLKSLAHKFNTIFH